MSVRISAEQLRRRAVVYVRQSTPSQVADHAESGRRQYALADVARSMGFAEVVTIDEDLGRSGSGAMERPGFQRLVAAVCGGDVGAVFCIEASRLARNGRDWHHLIDLCALVGALVVDPDGAYDPRLTNDRLLLGLKGTMSEYELTLLRQRSLMARDAKARRGELQCSLPPGYVWDERGRVVKAADARISEAVETVFRKFRELGSVRQVFLWLQEHGMTLPVAPSEAGGRVVQWRPAAYHNVMLMLRSPVYAGAYVFGRTETRTRIVDGRARKSEGHGKPRDRWSVLLRDHHEAYIAWEEFEKNQAAISENAHMQRRAARKSGRGGRALLTGMLRCGRCGNMLRVTYGMKSAAAHRYQCVGDQMRGAGKPCLGIGGVRVDRAISETILAVVQPLAIEAAVRAAERSARRNEDVRRAREAELEEARYDADLAARRHAHVDPAKRLVARELESRWEQALARVRELQVELERTAAADASREEPDVAALASLARDVSTIWHASDGSARQKQRIARILIREVVVGDGPGAESVELTVHWTGGRHSRVSVARRHTSRAIGGSPPDAVDAMRKLGGRWPDRQLAVTLNRLRCPAPAGRTWTAVAVRELRERLKIPVYDPDTPRTPTVSMDDAARRLGISVPSVRRLIDDGILKASQAMPSAPWEIPTAAIESEAVRIGVRAIVRRRPRKTAGNRAEDSLLLPGLEAGTAE